MNMNMAQTKQEQFINDLVQFYRNRGFHNAHPSKFLVKLNGKNVDLLELYTKVLEYGGSYKVNQFNLWDEIYLKLFDIDYVGANFAVALRQIFNRYLLQYEKSFNGNYNNEQWNEDDDDENAIFSSNHPHNYYSGQYSINQNHLSTINQPPICDQLNNIQESNGQIHNDSKLYCSLLSGLPNELQFAYNVATILTNSQHFNWHNDYKFINILIESIKSYCCVCDYFEEQKQFGRTNHNDEDNIIELESVIRNKFKIKNKNQTKMNGICKKTMKYNDDIDELPKLKKSPIKIIEHKCNCFIKFWHQTCSNEELLNLIYLDSFDFSIDDDENLNKLTDDFTNNLLPSNLYDKIERRIELIADMIRNISFTYDQNEMNHVSMIPLLRFLLLLLCSYNMKFINTSLDILSNISPSLSLSFSRPYEQEYLLLLDILFTKIIDTLLNSNNIYDITKSFEIIARYISTSSSLTLKIINNDANNLLFEKYIFEYQEHLYNRITELLTCHYDITLILAILEFCLVLSEILPQILINNDNKTLLKILINLLNCQASQYFTTGALQKIKIIDTKPNEDDNNNVNDNMIIQQPTQHFIINNNQNITQTVINNTTATIQMPTAPIMPKQPLNQQPQITLQPNNNINTNVPIINISNQQIQTVPPQIQQPQQQQQQLIQKPILAPLPPTTLNLNVLDNESFAINWLRTTYEEVSLNQKSSLKINDIYAEYVKHCCRNSRRNVIAAQSFNFLLKRCFPLCQINEQQQLVDGLSPKIDEQKNKTNLVTNTVNNQMSPILKAHLSTPPKTQLTENPTIAPISVTPQQTPTNASTLIKSLLANKLRNNQQQQQQQQQLQNQVNFVATIPQPATPMATIVAPNQIVSKPVGSETPQQPQQKNIIIAQNPSTAQFTLAQPAFIGNNIIVPTSMQQSPNLPLQGSQQIFLVRTFITGQNSATPVRLLLPASMIQQQRLPVPNNTIPTAAGAININGMNATPTIVQTNNPIQTTNNIITQQTALPQQQFIITQTSSGQTAAVPVIVSTNNATPTQPKPVPAQPSNLKTSSMANSSPLLNVLLDKGKLPDFPNHQTNNNTTTNSSIATITLNSNTTMPQIIPTTSTVATSIAQTTIIQNAPLSGQNTALGQPKMIILAPNNSTPATITRSASTELPAKVIIPDVKPVSNIATPPTIVSNIRLTTPSSTAPVTILNNDMKMPGKINIMTTSNPEINNKHSIENPMPDLNKRLKVNEVSQIVQTKSDGTTNQDNSKILSSNVQLKIADIQPKQQNLPNVIEYECLWNNCQMKFTRPSDVFYHVHSQHIMTPSCPNFMNCLWGGVEGRGPGCQSKRPKLSLLTHLQDYHCNPNTLKQEIERKKQLQSTGTTNIMIPIPPAHPGYGQNAAMLAIRRQINKTMEASEPFTPLTPLTVSIRLTVALILRNLAKRSQFIKKSLESFESQLCEISSAENRDESRTIAQCLAVLNEHK